MFILFKKKPNWAKALNCVKCAEANVRLETSCIVLCCHIDPGDLS
jgi:hypothetical protein